MEKIENLGNFLLKNLGFLGVKISIYGVFELGIESEDCVIGSVI